MRPGEIAYVASGRLFVVKPDGSAKTWLRLRSNVKPRCNGDSGCSRTTSWWSPSWSPNGRRLALVGTIDDGTMDGDNRVFIRDANGRTRQIFFSDVGTGGVAWAPNGKSIVHDTGRDTPALILLKPGATKAQLKGQFRAIRGGQDATWSPDARTLAFRYTAGEDDWGISIFRGIATMRPDGSHFKVLVRTGRRSGTDPDWSPDGRTIAFAWNGICTVDLKGHVTRLTASDDTQPSWSRRMVAGIVFQRGDGTIWIMDSHGRHQHELIEDGYQPDWSR